MVKVIAGSHRSSESSVYAAEPARRIDFTSLLRKKRVRHSRKKQLHAVAIDTEEH